MKRTHVCTNIVLNKNLVDAAMAATKIKTRKEVIDYALRELLRREAQRNLLQLRGKIKWEGDLTVSRKGRIL